MKNFFANRSSKKENKKIVIVSGSPRSGTSIMMKVLVEGGLPAVVDSLRQADEDNPNGHFEIEANKNMKDGKKMALRCTGQGCESDYAYFVCQIQ